MEFRRTHRCGPEASCIVGRRQPLLSEVIGSELLQLCQQVLPVRTEQLDCELSLDVANAHVLQSLLSRGQCVVYE